VRLRPPARAVSLSAASALCASSACRSWNSSSGRCHRTTGGGSSSPPSPLNGEMMARSASIKGAATADKASMAGFLDGLRSRYGDGAGYLTAHGLSRAELGALRSTLVEA
jgi:Tyrosine phosphatase family